MSLSGRYQDEKKLIRACLKNDRRAQELLYRNYFETMFSMCLRYTQDKEIALDIVNRGMLRVFKKLDKYSFKGSFEGWIRKIIFHSISEYFKKNNKYIKKVSFDLPEQASEESVLDELYYEDLLDMMQYVPESSLRVFKLFVLEGLSHKEIAQELGISEGTSKWHLNNARSKYRSVIEHQLRNHVG
jgi:RNA polymerase sigma-70 factor (ECF subfamily)